MGTRAVVRFICQICTASTETEVLGTGEGLSSPPFSAKVPEGWLVATPWSSVGMGEDFDQGYEWDYDDEWLLTFCPDCLAMIDGAPVQDQLQELADLPRVIEKPQSQATRELRDAELAAQGHFLPAYNCAYRGDQPVKVGYYCQECNLDPKG